MGTRRRGSRSFLAGRRITGRMADRGGTGHLRVGARLSAHAIWVGIAFPLGRGPSAGRQAGNAATTASGCRRHRAHLLSCSSVLGTTRCPGARGIDYSSQGLSMREAAALQFGRYFEEFEVGAVYKHWPGKTVTEYDDHLFCLITMNHHPLH